MTFTPPVSILNALDAPFDTASGAEQHHHGIETPGSTVITFVVSHLAAFDDMVEKRNANFHDLGKRLTFDSSVLAVSPGSGTSTSDDRKSGVSISPAGESESNSTMPGGMVVSQSSVAVPEKFGIYESDILFWMVSSAPLVSMYS